ncbi:unnamed protein product [Rhizophagus irregularis]|nr:unnamed protein product [Rhizophagus irregularis]
MSKTSKCSLRSITASVCDDVTNELCRRHYNKLIVNEKHRLMKAQRCAYPKHEDTKNSKRGRPRKNFLRKIPRRLLPILNLSPDSLICNPCLNNIDRDEEIQQSLNYRPPIRKISNSNTNPEYSYIFRNDLLYSLKEFKELETAYNEVCEELDLTKLKVGFLLSASGTSASAIEILANAGLTIRRETIQRPEHQLARSHERTVKDYIIENVVALIKESIQGLFYNYKDLAARMFIDLLDNTVPLCQCKVFQNTLSKAFDHFDDNVDEEDGEDLEDQDSGRFAGK